MWYFVIFIVTGVGIWYAWDHHDPGKRPWGDLAGIAAITLALIFLLVAFLFVVYLFAPMEGDIIAR